MTAAQTLATPQPKFSPAQALDVVDSHTCGQPTRVVLSGAGLKPGDDPNAARADMAANRDWVRRVAVFEPRGHRSMFAAGLIPPGRGEVDFGVVFMDANTYPDMCGHATIGLATTLFELGLAGPDDPRYTGHVQIGLRTPAGRVALRVTLKGGRCEAVAFQTPLAYHLGTVPITLVNGKQAEVEVAYGGQWYGFLDAGHIGHSVDANAIDDLIAAAVPVRKALAASLSLTDPLTGKVPAVGNIVWTSPPRNREAAGLNVPISSSGSFDRSPCGTATCARMATLVATGRLKIGTPFVNEGMMGTLYRGVPVRDHTEGNVVGIVPEVEGSAWLTARSQLLVDSRDPLRMGYLVGGGSAVL